MSTQINTNLAKVSLSILAADDRVACSKIACFFQLPDRMVFCRFAIAGLNSSRLILDWLERLKGYIFIKMLTFRCSFFKSYEGRPESGHHGPGVFATSYFGI
jgi:hypothetical protein